MTAVVMSQVGVDVSQKRFDTTLLKAGGGKRRKRFANTAAGIEAFLAWLKRQVEGPAHICMESTSVYWEALAEAAEAGGYKVSVVNPVRIKGYAMSQLRRSKTDPLDGDVIADFCRTQEPAAWTPPTAEQKKLRTLVRHLEALKKSRTQQLNRLATCRDEDVQHSLQTVIATLAAEMEQTQQQIDQLLVTYPELQEKKRLLTSIKGIGEKTALHILAEMYDLAEYANAKAAAADTGVTASEFRSGDTIRRRPKMSRMGKASLRAALYYPAITARQHNPVVKTFADRLAAKGKPKAVIRVAVMRKLMHLAYGVLKNQQPFDPNYAT